MNPPTDTQAVRLARALAALEDVQRWADNAAADAAELGRAEGFAAVVGRIGEARAALDVERPGAAEVLAAAHGGAAPAFAHVLVVLRELAAWAHVEAERARAEVGPRIEPEELRAAGRVEALEEAGEELRAVLESAPHGTA